MRRIASLSTLGGAATALAALLPALDAGAQQATGGRVVECKVDSNGKAVVAGKCRFSTEKGGSFVLENVDRKQPLVPADGDSAPGILTISVTMVSPGRAEVRGLTTSGINSRWGPARRSEADPACWVGDDFRVCAY